MDKYYQSLIDSIDELMLAMCKQQKLGLDPEVNDALKKVTRARVNFKKGMNLRALAQKQAHERLSRKT